MRASHPPVFPGPLRYLRLLSGLSKRDEKPVVSKVTELRSAAARMDDMFSDHAARQHALESASLSSSFSFLNPGCVPLQLLLSYSVFFPPGGFLSLQY